MTIATFAPHLAAAMLPPLFSGMPFAKRPRFPGDPWATAPHSRCRYWMHASGCMGLFSCMAPRRCDEPLPAQGELFS